MPAPDIARQYVRFADREAQGRSPLYEALSRAVATDDDILAFLASLSRQKQQPNLLLAAVRHLIGVPTGWPHFRAAILDQPDAVRAVMLTHATQTNEPGRCAALLPLLAQLPQPLALIEVGASAGLCLLPDHYAYDYGRHAIRPQTAKDPPVFTCNASPNTPLPTDPPEIVWRAGLDLNPLAVTNPAHVQWLETLVWPEQTHRAENLHRALAIAAANPPRLIKGDLLSSALADLCAQAPKHATLVVFHTAVLAYVAHPAARQAFARHVQGLCPYWISNEMPDVFPEAANGLTASKPGRFLMSLNGRPIAWTDPHGAAIDWIERLTASA